MIPTAGTQRIKRETTAPFQYEKDGRVVTETIPVLFYARTMQQIREQYQRNIQFGIEVEERERLRKELTAAQAELDTAKAALAAAPVKKALTAQHAVNDALRKVIDVSNAFSDKAKEIALREPMYVSTGLMDTLAGLPGLEDPSGDGEFKITVENLETLDVENLKAIDKAIEEALAPK